MRMTFTMNSITTKEETMKKITIYPRRKHTNNYTHQLISYNENSNSLYVMELHYDEPLAIVLFPASKFSQIIRHAKLVYMAQSQFSIQEVTEMALSQYFKNMITYKKFRRLAVTEGDYIFKNIVP